MRRERWDSETDAELLLEHFTGGRAERVDPGGGAIPLHDTDIHMPDGTTIAVEVTRHNRPSELATQGEVAKRDWRFEALRFNWVVDAISSFDVNALHRDVGALLSRLEEADITSVLLRSEMFDAETHRQASPEEHRYALMAAGVLDVGQRLFNMGLRLIYQLEEASSGDATVTVSGASRVGSTSPAAIISAVEHHAALPDNRAKLAAATDRAERHLLIWAESSRDGVVAAFDFSTTFGDAGLPDVEPSLPDEIDSVWIATALDPSHVWRYSKTAGWEDLGFFRREQTPRNR
jgi:hypothetical protein